MFAKKKLPKSQCDAVSAFARPSGLVGFADGFAVVSRGFAGFREVSRGFTSFRTYSLALYRKVLQVYQAQSVEELSCKGILDGHLLLVCTCIANGHIV